MKYSATLLFGVFAGLCVSLASAEEPAITAPAPAEYRPSMGDMMTMAVQPRHIKLGLAGREQNWAYATFEISELRNAFNRIAKTIPVYQNTDTAAMNNAMISAAIDAVEQAIKNNDATQFKHSYQALTNACNACHQAQKHAMVVIKVPDANAYPDQAFRPAGK